MLIAIGLSLILFGRVWSDLALATTRFKREEWARNWAQISASRPINLLMPDVGAIAAQVGACHTDASTLDMLADEIAARDSHPSERQLDQLRLWASSHLHANAVRGVRVADRVGEPE